MKRADDMWAEAAAFFVDEHYSSIRGRVRTYVIDQHLDEYLPEPPGKIVDVGGGAGTQSIPLARRGYQVTIIDPSPAMLGRASAALNEESRAVASRVRLLEGHGENAVEDLGGEMFDGVLCHGVLPYVNDPGPLIGSICALAAPGGIVSIVAKNKTNLRCRQHSKASGRKPWPHLMQPAR